MAQMSPPTSLPNLIRTHEARILADWIDAQLKSAATRRDLINEEDLRRQSKEFLSSFTRAAESGGALDLAGTQPFDLATSTSTCPTSTVSKSAGSFASSSPDRRPCRSCKSRAPLSATTTGPAG